MSNIISLCSFINKCLQLYKNYKIYPMLNIEYSEDELEQDTEKIVQEIIDKETHQIQMFLDQMYGNATNLNDTK
ncbi:hypothetical protein EHP00_214 [Ecytonucleospora hepatopenaei]|uniref:Uncharacterized protein n=1 Tax=Ecytonucleospora hepatopenaei TaxID=646526 RepID=A0A1W0E6I6_9MICR|nr:hypothetical protein EHP00_214 [Ecytonucleospora hepatopenaei]